ncbi:MAG: ArsR/SmtB family transcription factor [Pseudomonadota bacterium]
MNPLLPVFAALSDPTRFAIVERLLAEGEQSAGGLQAVADITAPAISRHLKVLREAGVIRQRIDAQRRYYSAVPEPLAAIARWTGNHRVFWETALDRLEAAIKSQSPKE